MPNIRTISCTNTKGECVTVQYFCLGVQIALVAQAENLTEIDGCLRIRPIFRHKGPFRVEGCSCIPWAKREKESDVKKPKEDVVSDAHIILC